MFSHDRIWSAIDALAERHQLSPSGLARRAGLDPTSFNKSKRHSADGRERWPSTESIAKVLDATGSTINQFMDFLRPGPAAGALPEGAFPPQTGSIPCSDLPRPGPAVSSTTAAFRQAKAGMSSSFRQLPARRLASMRWKSRATACCRSIATAMY